MRKIENRSDELETAFWDIGSASRLKQERHPYDSRAICSAIDQYCQALNQGPDQANDAAGSLLASLREVSQSDVAPRSFTYDFFRRRFEQEATKRKEITTALDKVLKNIQ